MMPNPCTPHPAAAAWPQVGNPAPVASLATGLPLAVWPASPREPHRPDPSLADPLRPATWRGLVPRISPPIRRRFPARPSAPDLSDLANRGLRTLGLWLALGLILLACAFQDWR